MKLLNYINNSGFKNEFLKMFKKLFNFIYEKILDIFFKVEEYIQIRLEPESEKNLVLKQNRFSSFADIIAVLGTRQKNKFYPANPSLWVVFVCSFLCILIVVFVSILHSQNFIFAMYKQFIVAIAGSVVCIVFWVSLFYKEKKYGYHTDLIRRNIVLGFWVFLFTEGLCFMSLFWTFFHSLLAASTHIGQYNPGEGIVNYYLDETMLMNPFWDTFFYSETLDSKLINVRTSSVSKDSFSHLNTIKIHFNLFDKGQLMSPYGYPGLNTLLLLLSAAVLNASHVKLKLRRFLVCIGLLILTIFIGMVFLYVQFIEIRNCTLQYNDGIYSCSFFSLTGLHGIHVILGVFALFVCLVNFLKGNYTKKRHDTFWCAVAYWHFVDVVWIAVFLLIYCWPSCFYFWNSLKFSHLDYKEYCININVPTFEEMFRKRNASMEAGLAVCFIKTYSECSTSFSIKKLIFKNLNLFAELHNEMKNLAVPHPYSNSVKRILETTSIYNPTFNDQKAKNPLQKFMEMKLKFPKRNFIDSQLYFGDTISEKLKAIKTNSEKKYTSEMNVKRILKTLSVYNPTFNDQKVKNPLEKVMKIKLNFSKEIFIDNQYFSDTISEKLKAIRTNSERKYTSESNFRRYLEYKPSFNYTSVENQKKMLMISNTFRQMNLALNIDLINKELNESRRKKTIIYILYKEIYENRAYLNYSEIKRSKDLHAMVINILHTITFDYLNQRMISDFTTWRGKIKFPILILLYNININWAFTFSARYTPYFMGSDFAFLWNDLIYTRKPKWVVKEEKIF